MSVALVHSFVVVVLSKIHLAQMFSALWSAHSGGVSLIVSLVQPGFAA